MEKLYAKQLVAVIGGYRGTYENRKSWLAKVAETAGISVRQAYAAFYQEYTSKNTQRKLETAAKQKVSENDSELILRLHGLARHLESVDAEMYRADIEAARRIIARYQAFASQDGHAPVPTWFLTDL